MKKILALVLALAMIMVVAVASATTVTITNAGADKTYSFKKAFEMTHSTSPEAVRTYTTDAEWAAKVAASGVMTATAGNSGEWNIDFGTSTAVQIRDWLQSNYADIPGSEIAASSGSATLTEGFYVMKVVDGDKQTKYSTIAVKDEASLPILDKNDTITIPDKEETIGETTYGQGHAGMTDSEKPTASVGDVIDYTVTGSFPMYIFNATSGETELVKKLTLTDSITTGLEYVPGSIALKINNANPDSDTTVVIPTVTAEDSTFTVTFTTIDSNGAFQYGSNNTYTLTYQAKITTDAIEDNEEQNTVTLKYDRGNTTNIDGGSDFTKVYHYDISLLKQDATTKDKLKGAGFELYTGAGETKTKLNLVLVPNTDAGDTYGTENSTVNNVYRLAEANETPVTNMVTGTTGIIEVKGLEAGTYYFKETVAPKGYNILKDYTSAIAITNSNPAQLVVDNNKGTELPSTGGIGTTIFYILGGLLVIGAAVVLVARRKAHD